MIALLALIPWVIAVVFLLIFISKTNRNYEEDMEYDSEDRQIVRVAVYKDRAYWVYENVFYESELMWEPDFTTAQPIDTMSLSAKEVSELLSILDELKEQEQG